MDETTVYHFNGSGGITDPQNVWTNDANAFDGDVSTSANTSDFNGSVSTRFLYGKGTTATNLGFDINLVRVRLNGGASGSESWTDWVTLTDPVGGWDWDIIIGMEVKLYVSAPVFDDVLFAAIYTPNLGTLLTTLEAPAGVSDTDANKVELEVTYRRPLFPGGVNIINNTSSTSVIQSDNSSPSAIINSTTATSNVTNI